MEHEGIRALKVKSETQAATGSLEPRETLVIQVLRVCPIQARKETLDQLDRRGRREIQAGRGLKESQAIPVQLVIQVIPGRREVEVILARKDLQESAKLDRRDHRV